jgi:hypothetical protein
MTEGFDPAGQLDEITFLVDGLSSDRQYVAPLETPRLVRVRELSVVDPVFVRRTLSTAWFAPCLIVASVAEMAGPVDACSYCVMAE